VTRRLLVIGFAALAPLVLGASAPLATAAARAAAQRPPVALIVRERVPASDAAERLVVRLGGVVERELPLVHGFSATLPARAVPVLRRARSVVRAWPDARLHMSSSTEDRLDLAKFDALPPNAGWRAAVHLPAAGPEWDGAGVTVALLDTGVADVADLGARVVERVDFTSERDGLDRYGHGTHMAGLIAGDGSASAGQWTGVAPGADLVSVKVAGADGSTDVSTVLAGLQWIVSNERRLHTRVLNLSFGTDSRQTAAIDPLNYAVEQVWASGIFVAVAAGNGGPAAGTVDKPGDDPYVLTVGAADAAGATAVFSARGPTADGFAKPDLVAPGESIVSLRAPGSAVDLARPLARVGDAYFKGTGTSQSTAIVSGVAALLFEADPTLTPDEAKAALTSTAAGASPGGGAGLVDAKAALEAVVDRKLPAPANAGLIPSSGNGSLEASRGSYHVVADPLGTGVAAPVVGETDVLGRPWSAKTWSSIFWGALWWGDPVAWSAVTWSAWTAKTWSAKTWSAKTWSASSWN
jgi:serine protease AprX